MFVTHVHNLYFLKTFSMEIHLRSTTFKTNVCEFFTGRVLLFCLGLKVLHCVDVNYLQTKSSAVVIMALKTYHIEQS